MVRINEILNTNSLTPNKAVTSEKSSASIINCENLGLPEDSFEKTDKSILDVLKSINKNNIDNVLYNYQKSNSISLLSKINKSELSDSEKRQIYTHLKSIAKPNSYSANELLACELLNELNNDDKTRIATLMHEITKDNVRHVYAKYVKLAKEQDETAATDEEKQKLKWFISRGVKTAAKRPESLYQGVLNNDTLNLNEKRTYLREITNKYIEFASGKNFSEEQLVEFKTKANGLIEKCTGQNNSVINNAKALEDLLYEQITAKIR